MNKIINSGLALMALAGAAAPALAQSNSVTTTGTTTIVRPVTITKSSDLAFGRIVRPSTGSATVTMANTADTVSADGSAQVLGGISTSRAKYLINGEGGQVVSISVPASFSMTGPTGATLLVTLDKDVAGTETLSNALGSAGSKAVDIGGSFPLTASTVTGAYTGTFNVDVAYQ